MKKYEDAPHCLFSIPRKELRIIAEITNRCNLRCKHCCTSSTSKGEDLDYSKLIEIVDSYNTSEIYITGGEPFLYRDLPLLLKELKKRDIFISLATNGTLNPFYNNLRFLDRIQVSVDGLPEDHNQLRGDTFNTIVKFAQKIRKFVNLRISFTIWKEKMKNDKYLWRYFEMIKRKFNPNEVIVNVVLPVGRALNLSYNISPSKEIQLKQKAIFIGESIGLNVKSHRNKFFTQKYECPAASKLLFINSSGIYPCSWMAKVFYDIIPPSKNVEKMKVIFENNLLKLLRKKKFSGCPVMGYLFTGEIGGKDPLFKLDKEEQDYK